MEARRAGDVGGVSGAAVSPTPRRKRAFAPGGVLRGLAAAGRAAMAGAFRACAPDASPLACTEVWNHCAIDCPGGCPLKFSLVDNEIAGVSVDKRAAACRRGRAMRAWANSPDRLMWPMRRVGQRGSTRFERVSWDEALDEVAGQLSRIIRTYGNDAVYLAYATGQSATTAPPVARLLNCVGGCLRRYNNYSNAQINTAVPCLYGWSSEAICGSDMAAAADAQMIAAFGASPLDTAEGGACAGPQWARACKQVRARGGEVVAIDPRRNGSVVAHPESWLPIRPGTDGALAAALAHEFVAHGWADLAFLRDHCVGFFEETLPDSARGAHLSYRDYLMGTGYDRVEKTPAWAAKITGVPAERIAGLAQRMAQAKPLFVMQGWGPQRRSNGEMTALSIAALPLLLGQVGAAGTNPGTNIAWGGGLLSGLPALHNPVRAAIPSFLFTDAVARGPQLTAERDGVKGAPRLHTGIKCIVNVAGNCLTNQHGDVNRSHRILSDPSQCEFIVASDVEFTDSARYADILLPDLFRLEQHSVFDGGTTGRYVTVGSPAAGARFGRRGLWDVCTRLARRLGVERRFTGGRTELEWQRTLYEADRARLPEWKMPSFDQAKRQGVWHAEPRPAHVALAAWRANPQGCPLATPSGKAELFSETLWKQEHTLCLQADDTLLPIPAYVPEWESGRVSARWPLALTGYHFRGRIHSSWGNVRELAQRFPQRLLMNPADAAVRGIADGDAVQVANERGSMRVPVQVTDGIMPGVVALPQGGWYRAEGSAASCASAFPSAGGAGNSAERTAIDVGGCLNVLTDHRPSPLAKANPQHTICCEVTRVRR